jgi:hypothetical protein
VSDIIVQALGRDLRSRADEVLREENVSATERRIEEVVAHFRAKMARDRADVAPLQPGQLADIPVVVADNVGRYVADLPVGTNVSDVVSTLVPPFKQMFVEVEGAPNDLQMRAWGAELSLIHDRSIRIPKALRMLG